MKLSVIVVSYKHLELISNCIDSILKNNDIGDRLEIIVSDNSPDDAIVNEIKKRFPTVNAFRNPINKGFGAGNNSGFMQSTGDIVLFLNPDTVLIEPVFSRAIIAFQNDQNLQMFGVTLLKNKKKKSKSIFFKDRKGLLAAISIRFCRIVHYFNAQTMFTSGADIFIRRSAFEKAGLFDESLFLYMEEADLSRRVLKFTNKKNIRFLSGMRIVHLENSDEVDSTTTGVARRKILAASEIYYCKKYGLNYKKRFRSEIRFNKIKGFVYSCFSRKYKAEMCKQINLLLKSYL